MEADPARAEPPPPPPRTSCAVSPAVAAIAIVGVLCIVFGVLVLPVILGARGHAVASNERNAAASLRTLVYAQTDFRSNDRDGDREMNYWVHDVYSLFAMVPSTDGTSPGASTNRGAMIKLIEPSIAAADAGGRPVLPGIADPMDAIGAFFTPKASYVFRPLTHYDTGSGRGRYGDPAAGKIAAWAGAYERARFAFLAAPVSRSGGRRLFVVSEDGSVWTVDPGSDYDSTYSGGARGGSLVISKASAGGASLQAAAEKTFPWPASPGASGWKKWE